MNSELQKAMAHNQKVIKLKLEAVKSGTYEGLEKAVIYLENEAKEMAMERIYRTPIRGNYVRTGLYKATLKGVVIGKVGYLLSPVVYSKSLEYKNQKFILTDTVFNNKEKIRSIIKKHIQERGKR